jgi:hypothetical protein
MIRDRSMVDMMNEMDLIGYDLGDNSVDLMNMMIC